MAFLKHPEHNILVGDDGTIIGPSRRILKHRVSCSGYARIVVYTNKKHQSVCVHRLVADVFLPDGVSEQVPRAKLTDDTVRRIRAEPKTLYGSAPWNRYGISKVMYRNIRIGKSWSHLPC